MMDGESLWSIYQREHEFKATDRILEIGPGYGRLLKTALKRGVPFERFVGLELSAARVEKLNDEFGSSKILFVAGDADQWRGSDPFDVVLCSSTFEHLHPDCRKALRNIRSQLVPGASVFIDFIGSIPRRILGIDPTPIARFLNQVLGIRLKYFEKDGTYIRIYFENELRAIFKDAGFVVQKIESTVVGEGETGPIKRLVVIAKVKH
jgi:SAM-dependent methyltransferase